MLAYREFHRIGAVYAEWQPEKGAHARFFQIEKENGETFLWIGRLHCIFTPWKRLTAALAAILGLFTPICPAMPRTRTA